MNLINVTSGFANLELLRWDTFKRRACNCFDLFNYDFMIFYAINEKRLLTFWNHFGPQVPKASSRRHLLGNLYHWQLIIIFNDYPNLFIPIWNREIYQNSNMSYFFPSCKSLKRKFKYAHYWFKNFYRISSNWIKYFFCQICLFVFYLLKTFVGIISKKRLFYLSWIRSCNVLQL